MSLPVTWLSDLSMHNNSVVVGFYTRSVLSSVSRWFHIVLQVLAAFAKEIIKALTSMTPLWRDCRDEVLSSVQGLYKGYLWVSSSCSI